MYAGHLGEDRPPLAAWDDVDETGLRVRWISITPFTAWSDPLNSDNPQVVDDFAAWLAEHPADVVHLHSLQTFGGGLVSAAARSGARVVVTMHDFWWACARQFLVAPDLVPCSLVVQCGDCPCAVDHEWLIRRNRRLANELAQADLVLAPSRSAADVIAANGVDGRRLQVDENGLPALPRVVRDQPRPDGLRLMFAGGSDPMKGLPVLAEALPEVPPGDWSIDLYGVDKTRIAGLGPHVQGHRPFDPADLAAVLAAHDILVLPSIMRESHSILTREALGAGLAVVCTDTLGPEEVVEDGVNGLVVRAADSRALAVALRTLVADPARVARMQEQAVSVRVRSLEDHVAGTEQLYTDLVDRAEVRPAPIDQLVHRVLFVVGIQGAPLRYRAQLPAEALAERGVVTDIRHYRDPELPQLAAIADAAVLYRVPATHQVLDLVRQVKARERRIPVLFDVDDLIVDPGLRGQVHGLEGMSDDELDLWWHGVERYRTTLEQCDAYIGSTDALCGEVARLTGMPVHRYANGVGTALGRLSEAATLRSRRPGALRVGYFSGTTTHDADWALIEPAVVEVMRRHPDVELWLGGSVAAGPLLDEVAARVKRLPMVDWTQLPERLRDVDVNLAPLVPGSIFNESKSAIKWLEAALVATPTVASPTQPFQEAIEHDVTGMLAGNHDAWVEALDALISDEHRRSLMGARARRAALLRWSPALQGRRYLEILAETAIAVRRDPERRTSTWPVVADDEPFSPADAWVEPYPPQLPRPASPMVRRIEVVRRVYRSGGVRAVAGKVAARARRR